jgi:hypothetical protein
MLLLMHAYSLYVQFVTQVSHPKTAEALLVPQSKRNFLRQNISLEHFRTAPKYNITYILKIICNSPLYDSFAPFLRFKRLFVMFLLSS